MTLMLEKNKRIMSQVTTLSSLMVNISSCVKFDRYRGYDSADELNAVAQDLAKKRDLYASEYNGQALFGKSRLIQSSGFIRTVHLQPAMVCGIDSSSPLHCPFYMFRVCV